MISNKDNEFLLWLAKRLVFKYGENKEIIDMVYAITQKNTAISTALNNICSGMEGKIQSNIKILQEILKDIKTNKSEVISTINHNKSILMVSKFENIDIDAMLTEK